MKTIVLFLLCSLCTTFLNAQTEMSNTKKREVALTINKLNEYGLSYKFGNEKALWRLNAFWANNRSSIFESDDRFTKSTRGAYSLSFGRDWIKPLSEKLEFRYGAALSAGYNFSKSEQDDLEVIDEETISKNITFRPGVVGVLGFHYALNKFINIGAESTLSAGYSIGKTTRTAGRFNETFTNRGFDFGMENVAALVITCKF